MMIGEFKLRCIGSAKVSDMLSGMNMDSGRLHSLHVLYIEHRQGESCHSSRV